MTIMGSNHMHDNFRGSEEKKEQYIKYAKDPVAFIIDYGYGFNSITAVNDVLPIKEFQKDIINHIQKNNYSIIKKSRQMYVSSTMAMYMAWSIIFKFDYQVAILSSNKEGAIRVLDMVKKILVKFYDNWSDEIVKDNKSELRLANGSFIKAFAAKPSACRGYSIDFLFIDEAAYIKDLEKIWSGLIINLKAKRGKCVIASTPNNLDFFYTIWSGATKGENDFASFSLDWTMNPDYTKDMQIECGDKWSPWYEKMCKSLGYDQDSIARELRGEFIYINKPSSYRVNFRMETEIYEKMMKKISGENNISDYIRELIEKDLQINE